MTSRGSPEGKPAQATGRENPEPRPYKNHEISLIMPYEEYGELQIISVRYLGVFSTQQHKKIRGISFESICPYGITREDFTNKVLQQTTTVRYHDYPKGEAMSLNNEARI